MARLRVLRANGVSIRDKYLKERKYFRIIQRNTAIGALKKELREGIKADKTVVITLQAAVLSPHRPRTSQTRFSHLEGLDTTVQEVESRSIAYEYFVHLLRCTVTQGGVDPSFVVVLHEVGDGLVGILNSYIAKPADSIMVLNDPM